MSICEKAFTCGNCCTTRMFEGNDYMKLEKNVLIKMGDKHPTPGSSSFPVNRTAWGLLVGGPISTDRVAPHNDPQRVRGCGIKHVCMPTACQANTGRE